jgi:GNAT superfamily N-acetyltransferase
VKPASTAFTGVIRLAHPLDHLRIAELAGQLSYPSTPAEIAHRLQGLQRTAEAAVFVAELETGEIAGWIAVFVYRTLEADARAEVSGLVVDERFRSQRIGEHLLARANVIRDRAHAFYERHGYAHVKTQKAFRKRL